MLVGSFNTLVNRALGGEGSQNPKPLEASYTHTSEGLETSTQKHSTRRIRFCLVRFCSDVIWKVILKKEVNNESHKNVPSKSGFSSPRTFQWYLGIAVALLICVGELFFVCVYWRSNPAVLSTRLSLCVLFEQVSLGASLDQMSVNDFLLGLSSKSKSNSL